MLGMLFAALACLASVGLGQTPQTGWLNVRDFGAKGDGETLDSGAINAAIDAAATKGGGSVLLPAGTYLSASIHLKSNINLYLDAGAVILAAPGAVYDPAEDNANNKYQDYGHTHFHNSLLWGENLHDVSILGKGVIYGKGLVHDGTRSAADGNKSISLRECRNVTLDGITIRHGGWFCILATGVDHLTISNLLLDTNRDGMDVDCCRDVHISNCSVNSPGDDGICLKSSYPLGYARATEDVTITNCLVSGYKEGTFLDGTLQGGGGTGRIKFGTESNGGFKNISISNCVFDHCCGLALETVDGGLLEDVTISNITMRDIANAPIFLRLGRRMRGPEGTPVGKLRRISISDMRVAGARESSIISGVPGYEIEDVSLSNIRIHSRGGAKPEQSHVVPKEDEKGYPEPGSLGAMPSHGFFVRHAKDIEFHNVEAYTDSDDGRPPFVLDDVDGIELFAVKASRAPKTPFAVLQDVKGLNVRFTDGVRDAQNRNVSKGTL